MSAVADVLNGAADLIERDGWVQENYRGAHGERCLTRAISDVAGGWHTPVYGAACNVVRAVTGAFFLTGFNDTPGRTKAEVVAALRAAAHHDAVPVTP